MENIIDLIVTNGTGVVLLAYFLYKDWKWNASITNVLGEIKEVLAELRASAKSDK